MSDTNKALARRWFEEVWNKSRREAIAEMLASGAVLHEAGQTSTGPEGFYPFFDRMHTDFSDIHVTVHDTVAEGDQVCVRWTCKMRHTGSEGFGIAAATGKTIEVTGMSLLKIKDNHLVEGWQNWDMMALMEQIQSMPKAPTYVAARN